jgi:hypothetical protein
MQRKVIIRFGLLVFTFIALSFLAFNAWFNDSAQESDQAKHQAKTALEAAGEQCDVIAEKSVAHLTAVVAFQKLEIYGRKINVMRRCMKDHGFVENPEWLSHATPISKKNALSFGVSEDEALENLKRIAMYEFIKVDSQPLYWKQKTSI